MTTQSHIRRFGAAAFVVLFAVAAADAQIAPPTPPDPVAPPTAPEGLAEPERVPGDARDPAEELNALFTELAVADQGDRWQAIEHRIWILWSQSPSPSERFLMSRAVKAMNAKKFEDALLFLDDLTRLAPDFAEAWNKRATIHFILQNYGQSVADIQRTLVLEPRHFGALSGLGMILERLDRPEDAIQVYRRALEIHPHLQGAKDAVERLSPEVEGREL